MPATISKSKYLAGLQCPLLLWTHYNDPEALPPPDAAREAIFAAGHEVGDLAKRLHPGGVEIPYDPALAGTVEATRALLPRRAPLFEASFAVDNRYCRADLLVPSGGDAWDLQEVKSGTSVKDVNLDDVAFQADVLEGAGLRLDRLHLVHLDRRYVRQDEIEPEGLFRVEDVTGAARERQPRVRPRVDGMLTVIAGPRPEVSIGERCFAPYRCDLWPRCSAFLPEHPVLELYRVRKARAFDWIRAGRRAIADLAPADLNAIHAIQAGAVRSGRPHVEPDRIRAWLADLEYPLHCLDFETMNPAVPLLRHTRPYQQVPFQLSLHVIERAGAAPRHVEHLAETPEDPRPGVIRALRAIGPRGTVLAYNMSFERRVLRELAEAFPSEAAALHGIERRLRDLMDPFARFWYHDARQRGSCSLKAVLPVLTGTSYEGLAIAEGDQAQREYRRVVHGDVEPPEKARVLQALREYCRQDTRAMVDILEALELLV